MMINTFVKSAVLLVSLCILGNISYAQKADTAGRSSSDSKTGFAAKLLAVKKIAGAEANRASEKYKAEIIARKQRAAIDEIRTTIRQAEIFLKKKLDTTDIYKNVQDVDTSLKIVNEGILVNRGAVLTQRNLSVSSAILSQLISEMNMQKKQVDTYMTNLANYRDRIDSLSSDSIIYSLSADSSGIITYIKRLAILSKETTPVDSSLNKAISTVQSLQSKVDLLIFSLRSTYEEIESDRRKLSSLSVNREFGDIWASADKELPFHEIVKFSVLKEWIAFKLYSKGSIGSLTLLAVLIALSTFFIRTLKQKLPDGEDFKQHLVTRYPVLSALLIVISLYQFVFINSPFIFAFLIWVVQAICLSIIFYRFITWYWMTFWIMITLLFIAAGLDNLLLQASGTERWIMLILSGTGAAFCTYILSAGRQDELKEKYIIYSIRFFIYVEIAAAVLNISGRYNLAKALLIAGYISIVLAIIFLWVTRLINDGLSITNKIYKRPERKLFYINFDKIGDKVPFLIYGFLFIGWFVLVGRNFYAFKQVSQPITDFFVQERTVGSYTFTISGLFLFLFIITCSMLLSKVLSFFADGQDYSSKQKSEKPGFMSWLLLVRIAVISLGLFLAFAAAGIPIDKITFLLGALGVGIGLGLQGLVNNLVSGLIIAFERPVSVGDIIQINGQRGLMKSIGFRSSTVKLTDGAYLILPNGDLLSQHLINWTKGNNLRKLTLPVSVSYGSDLAMIKDMLADILLQDTRILTSPAPVVVVKELAQSSIDFELVFWTHLIDESGLLISDIILKIDSSFSKAGIVIPYQQHDIYIKSMSDLPLKK